MSHARTSLSECPWKFIMLKFCQVFMRRKLKETKVGLLSLFQGLGWDVPCREFPTLDDRSIMEEESGVKPLSQATLSNWKSHWFQKISIPKFARKFRRKLSPIDFQRRRLGTMKSLSSISLLSWLKIDTDLTCKGISSLSIAMSVTLYLRTKKDCKCRG